MKTLTETLQALATDASTTRERAIVRAIAVQKEIDRRRHRLNMSPDPDQDRCDAALLASYDRELTRLCQIPGVLAAVLAEVVIEEVAP